MPSTIWWARRDLRLSDNQALAAALDAAGANEVIPVFVLDPDLLGGPDVGEKRLAFLFGGLRSLDEELRARGSRLLVRRGNPGDELAALLGESGAAAVFAEADPWPYARRRDTAIAERLPLRLVDGLTVHPLDLVRKPGGGAYTVFTPFARAWRAFPLPQEAGLLPAPARIFTPSDLRSLPVPDAPMLSAAVPFLPGEREALRRLDAFASGDAAPIQAYESERDRPALPATSQLSPYLRFGMLSARRAAAAAASAIASAPGDVARGGAETWLGELIWRDFYMAILYYFPDVLKQSFRAGLRSIPWSNDEAAFAAWRSGRTGYPIVDAGVRQLLATGWMHNRVRMIVASFLVKDLLIDWQWGERFFMQHLLDADPAANNGGWQWTAGTGTDAAPYFRVFSPVLQGAKYDPEGDYVRRWVPELREVPTRYIHAPWRMAPDLQRVAGWRIGRDYPAPIVDHAQARERALFAYRAARQGPA